MRTIGFVIGMLMLATLACSLGGGDEQAATSIPIISRTSTAVTPIVAITPSPTTQLQATPTEDLQLGNTNTNCVVRSDWQVYTVQSGDTLGTIAARINSTAGELTSGNCLANPDAIFVGQQLRVPRLPTTSTTGSTTGSGTTGSTTSGSSTTGTTTGSTTGSGTTGSTTSGSTTGSTTGSGTTGSTTTGSTTGSGTVGGNTAGGSTTLAPNFGQNLTALPVTAQGLSFVTFQPTIALTVGVVDNADTVRYYAGVSATDTSPVNVATDVDPFDGTQIEYTFNDFDPDLYFWAVAENEFGARTSNVIHVIYNPTTSGGQIAITPNIGFDGALYTLQYGATVTLTWAQAPTNATRIDFYLTPGGTGTTPVLIGSDNNPADGATLSWTVPQWTLAHLNATAIFGSGIIGNSTTVNVYSEGVTPSGN